MNFMPFNHLICLLLTIFLNILNFNCQSFTKLIPEGEIPKEIKSIFVPYKYKDISVENYFHFVTEKDYHYLSDQLLSSGLIVFGTEEINQVAHLVNKIKNANRIEGISNFYLFRSSSFGGFQSKEGSIILTTGLLAQISSEGELAYFIARELAIKKLGYKNSSTKKIVNENDYDEIINSLWTQTLEREYEIDLEVKTILINAGYSVEDLISALNLISVSQFPFEDIEISSEAFKNDFVNISEKLFDRNFVQPNQIEMNSEIEKKIKNRIAKIGGGEQTTNSILKPDETLIQLRNKCRLENILQHISKGEHHTAMYEVIILKKLGVYNETTPRLEAMTWLSHIQFINLRTKPFQIRNASFISYSKSASFFNFVKILNAEGLTVLSLRRLKDIMIQNPEDEIIRSYYLNAIKLALRSKHFNVNQFIEKSKAYQNKISALNEDSTMNKVNSIKSEAEKNQINELENYFYLILIPDIIESDLIIQVEIENSTSTYNNELYYNRFKKNRYLTSKSEKRRNQLTPLGNVMDSSINNKTYYSHYLFSQLMTQAFHNADEGGGFIPLSSELFKTLNRGRMVSYNFFNEDRRIHFKKIYFIGLTGIGLLYVIPDLLMNRSKSNQFFINTNQFGEVINYKLMDFKDPLKKHYIKGRLFYSNHITEYEIH